MDKFAKSYSSFNQNRLPKRKGGIFSWRGNSANSAVSTRSVNYNLSGLSRPSSGRRGAARSWKKTILIGSLIFTVLAWFALMLYLPYFRIYSVSFEGLKTIEQDEIQNYVNNKFLRSGIIPSNNYFIVRSAAIKNDLMNKYSLNKAEVTKIFPGKILIQIDEKNTSIVYDNGVSYSLLDKSGTVIKMLFNYSAASSTETDASFSPALFPPQSGGVGSSSTAATTTPGDSNVHRPDWRKLSKGDTAGLPVFYDRRGQEVWEKKDNVIPSNVIQSIIDWQEALEREAIGDARYFEIDNPAAGIAIHLDRPWLIYYQPFNSLDGQMTNLRVILNSRTANPSEYIDLRFGDRVFWK